MRCCECKFWHLPNETEGNGTGIPYDAGHMNYRNHKQVSGDQHPSYGACGEPKTMVYTGTQDKHRASGQLVMTRRDFGCVLFEHYKLYSSKPVSPERK